MWEKMWTWADVKMSRCERRCERRCEDEQMWEKMWRWADVKMSRCERRCEDEQMREDRCERRCEDEQMWRWADVREDVKMSRCEDEQMWEKMWRWADVKMSRCERRCEDEQMFRRCEDEKMFYRPPLLEEPCAQTLSGKRPHLKNMCLPATFFMVMCRFKSLSCSEKKEVFGCSGLLHTVVEVHLPRFTRGRSSQKGWWMERLTVSHYLNELSIENCLFRNPVIRQSPYTGLPQMAPWHHVGVTMDITLDKIGSLNRSIRNWVF